jgi:hypothetical protein
VRLGEQGHSVGFEGKLDQLGVVNRPADWLRRQRCRFAELSTLSAMLANSGERMALRRAGVGLRQGAGLGHDPAFKPGFVRAGPALSAPPGSGCPSFHRLLRQPQVQAFSPPLKQQRLTAHEAGPERIRHHVPRPYPDNMITNQIRSTVT